MFYFVVGYLFLFIFRPYEYWPILGAFHIERIYMISLMIFVLLWKEKRFIPHSINSAILFFFLAMVVSGVLAFSWDAAYQSTFNYFKLLVFYFIIVLTIRDERDLKNFIIAYLIIMFLYVGKSAWEFFLHDRFMWRMGIKRMAGIDITYGDPNAFAASIAYSLPFLWAMLKYQLENRWTKMMLLGYGILALVSVIYTGSRSGMVTVLLFVALAAAGSSKKVLAAIMGAFLLITVWAVMPEEYHIRFKSIFVSGIAQTRGADESAEGRIVGFLQGIKLFKKYPIFGIGPGNFRYGWEGIEVGPNAHSLYGQLLGELGLLGFVAFFLLVHQLISTHRKIIKESRVLMNSGADSSFFLLTSTACLQTLILLLFNGLAGHNLYRYNWLWICAIGLLANHFLQHNQTKDVLPDNDG